MRSRLLLLLMAALVLCAEGAKQFKGTWASSNSGTGGAITMNLAAGEDVSKNSVTFTLSGYEIKTVIRRLKLAGPSVEVQYQFDIEGNRLTSTVTGTITGDKLEGKYVTTSDGDSQVDNGTFTTTLVK